MGRGTRGGSKRATELKQAKYSQAARDEASTYLASKGYTGIGKASRARRAEAPKLTAQQRNTYYSLDNPNWEKVDLDRLSNRTLHAVAARVENDRLRIAAEMLEPRMFGHPDWTSFDVAQDFNKQNRHYQQMETQLRNAKRW